MPELKVASCAAPTTALAHIRTARRLHFSVSSDGLLLLVELNQRCVIARPSARWLVLYVTCLAHSQERLLMTTSVAADLLGLGREPIRHHPQDDNNHYRDRHLIQRRREAIPGRAGFLRQHDIKPTGEKAGAE